MGRIQCCGGEDCPVYGGIRGRLPSFTHNTPGGTAPLRQLDSLSRCGQNLLQGKTTSIENINPSMGKLALCLETHLSASYLGVSLLMGLIHTLLSRLTVSWLLCFLRMFVGVACVPWGPTKALCTLTLMLIQTYF